MKKKTNMGLVIAFATITLGALAVSPRPGNADTNNIIPGNTNNNGGGNGTGTTNSGTNVGTGQMSPADQEAYRQAYSKSFNSAKEAQAQALQNSPSSSGGCCG